MKRNKKEIEGRPTKDLVVDETQLSEEDKEELHTHSFPLSVIITIAVVSLLMIACIIVIIVLSIVYPNVSPQGASNENIFFYLRN